MSATKHDEKCGNGEDCKGCKRKVAYKKELRGKLVETANSYSSNKRLAPVDVFQCFQEVLESTFFYNIGYSLSTGLKDAMKDEKSEKDSNDLESKRENINEKMRKIGEIILDEMLGTKESTKKEGSGKKL